ncbi:keywimysin-related RiPP [Streptosporangium sp. NPDC006013]
MKVYQAPALVARGSFAADTAGSGCWVGDQLVGRLIAEAVA